MPAVDAPAGDDARGGLHLLLLPGEAVLIAVAADAPGSVAAHLPLGAVGVVEEHPEAAPLSRGLHHHQTVGPDGEAAAAEHPGQPRQGGDGQVLRQIVEDNKVVAGPVHLGELHGGNHLLEFFVT